MVGSIYRRSSLKIAHFVPIHDITEILLKVALNTITIHVKVLQSQKKKIGIETRAEKQIAVYFHD
jgi:hypothetical protein